VPQQNREAESAATVNEAERKRGAGGIKDIHVVGRVFNTFIIALLENLARRICILFSTFSFRALCASTNKTLFEPHTACAKARAELFGP
jgi:hypothetical protein